MRLHKGKYIFINNYERESFKDDFPFMTNNHLSQKYKCSWRTVVRLARAHKLEKDELFRYQFDFRKWGALGGLHPNSIATRFKPGTHPSPATEFQPGHVYIYASPGQLMYKRFLKQMPAY